MKLGDAVGVGAGVEVGDGSPRTLLMDRLASGSNSPETRAIFETEYHPLDGTSA
jgi:hypothetical protein